MRYITYRFPATCAVLALATSHAGAQTQVDLRTQSKSVDFSAASSTKPFQTGTALPGACSQGQTLFKTNAPAGANFYGCTSSKTWTQEGGTSILGNNNAWSGKNDFSGALSVSLPAPWVATTVSNIYTAGAKQLFLPSATTAGLRVVAGSIPSTLVGGDFFITPTGRFGTYDGANANIHPYLAGSGSAQALTPTSGNAVRWGSNFAVTDAGAPSVLTSRTLNTAFPLTGGGDLSADRTLAIAANGITSTQMAAVNARRTCSIVVGADNAPVLVTADLGPQGRRCFIPAASTVVEVTVAADAGTPSVIVRRNVAGTVANLTIAALATASSGGIACSNTGGTTGIDGATTCSGTLQITALAAGSWIELLSGTAGGVARRMSISITYTIN